NSMASAIRCADECQNVSFPSRSSQVCSLILASLLILRFKSQTSPFTETDKTSFASLGEMEFAISYPVTPSVNSLTLLSGSVICIIFVIFFLFQKSSAKIIIHSLFPAFHCVHIKDL